MNRRAVIALVRASARALKAVGYYDGAHPILQQLHRELHGHLKEALKDERAVTLACAGAKLLIGESEKALTDEPSKALAAHLFSRSIVAVKMLPALSVQDLGVFLQGLAEAPEKLREVGGLQPMLQRHGAKGIDVFEVDFANLFSGKKTDIAGDDPLMQLALRELLRFKENKDRTGTALGISLDGISSPESLGALLDELLVSAGPGVAAPSLGASGQGSRLMPNRGGPAPPARASAQPEAFDKARDRRTDGRGVGAGPQRGSTGGETGPLRGTRGGGTLSTSALAGISAEELAELASQAFHSTCEKLGGQGAPESQLMETAKVLTSALVRLSPEARFSLLRQLAGSEGAGSGSGSVKGLKSLSSQIQDNVIAEAISSVIAAQKGDPELVESIGKLLKQLRPIESERRRLLDSVDETLRAQGSPIDGTLWQELQSDAMESNGLGMLEIPFRRNLGALAERAQTRIKNGANSPEIQRVLATLDPRHRAARSAKLLSELLPDNRELTPAMAAMAKDIIDGVEAGEGAPTGEHLKLLASLVKRAEGQSPVSAISQTVKELLAGPKGAQRAIALVKSQACKGSAVLAEALLQGLDAPLKIDAKKELMATFLAMDDAMGKSLRVKVADAKPSGVYYTVMLALRSNPAGGLEVARQAMRNKSLKAKESALKALATSPNSNAVAMLARAAGCDADQESAKLLCLDQATTPEAEETLRSLQRTAIEALGLTRSELAVPPLENLLNRRKLVGNSAYDSLCPHIAAALAANATATARRVLQVGKESKHRAIRDACQRAG